MKDKGIRRQVVRGPVGVFDLSAMTKGEEGFDCSLDLLCHFFLWEAGASSKHTSAQI